jgi:hypothetical protein
VFYERIVTARLHIATASVLCELDDDDPFEDESALIEHLDAVSVIGRCEPAGSLRFLASALQAARARLSDGSAAIATSAAASVAPAPIDLPATAASTAEECWWLLAFSGHLLADEAKGESPTVPEALRLLSHAASKHVPSTESSKEALASTDPVIRASTEALLLCQQQSRGHESPLLAAQVLWFLARWARTYALPDSSLYTSRPLSKALAACYGSDPDETLAALAGGLGQPSPLGLVVLPTQPGLLGRAVLDFVVQVRQGEARSFLCVSRTCVTLVTCDCSEFLPLLVAICAILLCVSFKALLLYYRLLRRP